MRPNAVTPPSATPEDRNEQRSSIAALLAERSRSNSVHLAGGPQIER
jgi:hypothetical protein